MPASLAAMVFFAFSLLGDAVFAAERWYKPEQVASGEKLFQQHCAGCHGDQAQGTVENWKQTLPDGSYPPPPLNGSAHAWHHSMSVLHRTIRDGGIRLGGKMPPFGDKLDTEQIVSIIAFFQSKWNDDIYDRWMQYAGLK